jgi:hypothetical protein
MVTMSDIGDFVRRSELLRERPDGPHLTLLTTTGPFGGAKGSTELLYLAYPADVDNPRAYLEGFCAVLGKLEFPADHRIATSVLGILADTIRPDDDPIEFIFDALVGGPARYQLAVVFTLDPKDKTPWHVGAARFEPFDPTNLLLTQQICGCAWPIDLTQFAGCYAIRMAPAPVNIIHFNEKVETRLLNKWGEDFATSRVVDSYFQAVHDAFFAGLPEHIIEHLSLLEAGRLLHIDINSLLNRTTGTLRIGAFAWHQGELLRGWALLTQHTELGLTVASPKVVIEAQDFLRDEFDLDVLGDAALDPAIKSYTAFLRKAWHGVAARKNDEAFLNFGIALDLLLGDRERISASIKRRGAILTDRDPDRTIRAQKKLVGGLYDVRSRYVHDGRPVSLKSLRAISSVCEEVLWSVLRARRLDSSLTLEEWRKELDHAYEIASSGVEPEGELLRRIGKQVDDPQTPPKQVDLFWEGLEG